jgi:hypothetical protein
MVTVTVTELFADGSPASVRVEEMTVTDAFHYIRNGIAAHTNCACCPPRELPFGVSWTSEDGEQEHRLTTLLSVWTGVPYRFGDERAIERLGGSIDRVPTGVHLVYPPDNR